MCLALHLATLNNQKLMRALSWISRPGVETSVMLPKLDVFTNRFGVPSWCD